MNDFFEWFVPCSMFLSIALMTFGFVGFMRLIGQKERAALAEYGLLPGHQRNVGQQSRSRLRENVTRFKKSPVAGKVTLTNPTVQIHLEKALNYKTQIDQMARHSGQAARLEQVTQKVDGWVEAIKDLALRIDHFQQDPLICSDLETVPEAIETLKRRLSQESDEAYRADLQRILENYRRQLVSLAQLENLAQRAELQIESTLSSLGIIYSQILAGQSASQVADYSHLSAQVDEEIHRLQDHLDALKEVKLGIV